MDKAAEEITAAHAWRQRRLRDRCRAVGRHKPEGAVRAMLVVMPDIDTQHALEMAAANDKDPVEAVGADGSDPAFGVGVRVWRSNLRADHLDSLGTEDLIEPAAELRVAIVDQKPEWLLIASVAEP